MTTKLVQNARHASSAYNSASNKHSRFDHLTTTAINKNTNKALDLEISLNKKTLTTLPGMHSSWLNSIESITEYTINDETITKCILDLGKGGAQSTTTANRILGPAAGALAVFFDITGFGSLVKIYMRCVESIVGSDTVVDLVASTSATDLQGFATTNKASLASGQAFSVNRYANICPVEPYIITGAKGQYVYLEGGSTTGGTYTAGKFEFIIVAKK